MIKKKYTIILSLLGLFIAFTVLLIPFVSKYLVNEALLISEDSNRGFNNLILYIILISISVLLAIIAHIVYNFLYSKFYLDSELELKNKLYNSLVSKDINELLKYRSGDIEVLYEQDIANIIRKYLQTIPSLITQIARALIALTILIIVDETKYKLFAIVIVLLGLIALVLAKLYSKIIKRHHKRVLEDDSNASSFIIESFENNKLIKSFDAENRSYNKFVELNTIARRSKGRRNLIIYSANGFVYAFTSLVFVSSLVFGSILISLNLFSYGSLLAVVQLINSIESPFMNLSSYLNQYHLGSESENRINNLLELSNDSNVNLVNDFNEIVIDNVSYYYDVDKYIIKNLSFNIKKSSIVKISGPSGIGKTTLFMLLLGFLKPNSGNIRFDSNIASKSTRNLISYVSVDNILFSLSIRENIKMLTGVTDINLINEALTKVNLLNEINNLDGKLDYKLTKGKGLSEGQMERLSIALALLRDKPILLLDEITSQLDKDNEDLIINNLLSLNKTIIYITHKRNFSDNEDVIKLGE